MPQYVVTAMRGEEPRRLIWVPIIHTQEDLGSLKEPVRRLHVKRTGRAQWQRKQLTIEAMWTDIEQEVERLDLDNAHLRLYQDGLACCGREEEIVRELAGIGSRNHQLLLKLMARGARIMGTESPELLLEEYEFSRHAILAASSRKARNRRTARGQRTHLEETRCLHCATNCSDLVAGRDRPAVSRPAALARRTSAAGH